MSDKNILPCIRDKFINLFTVEPIIIEAPGRINLIGEHTDYNDGFVMPAAIDMKATFALALNQTNDFRFYASDLDQHYQTKMIEPAPADFHWANYLLGVLAQFQNEGLELSGIDCVFQSTIPIGAGLSSSAALECGFAYGLNILLDSGFSKYQLVKMAQKAEHDYAKVMCGIMDQYASIFGKKDYVFKLDCRSHKHSYFHLGMDNHIIALVDTGVKHELASSEYNLRRQECDEGVKEFKKADPNIEALRDVSLKMLSTFKSKLSAIVYNRCHFVIHENKRVEEACDALENKNYIRFGELMYQSHIGLKNEYEVSCNELDILVNITLSLDYVMGARMMGGGFGGCTINLIQRNNEEKFRKKISEGYYAQTGIKPKVYIVKLSDGVKQIYN